MFFSLIGLLPPSLTDPAISPVYLVGGSYLAILLIGVLVDLVLLGRFLTLPPAWSDLSRQIGARLWMMRDALWILLILLLIQACAGMTHWLGSRLGWFTPDEKEITAALIQGILFQGVALLIVGIIIRRRKSSWSAAFGMNWPGFKRAVGQGLTGYVGIMPIVFFTSILYQLFLYMAGCPVTLQDVVEIFLRPQSAWSLFSLLLLAIVVAPIVEEALFRGILLPALMKKTGAGMAVVISSLLFAGMHQHLPSLVPLFVLAVALALLYIYSGSLWTPIMLHAVFNGVSICILLLTYPG